MAKQVGARSNSKRTSAERGGADSSFRAKIRMYRQGLGDCFLVTLPRTRGAPFYMLIDCGVVLGTQDASGRMAKVMADIVRTTAGNIDVLVVTHEHWDHLSGFIQASEQFERLTIGEL